MSEQSKYAASWRTGEKNEEFWREVMVGRCIRSASYHGLGNVAKTVPSGTELRSNVSLALDSGEIIYLAGDPDFGDLDLIAPSPSGPVGQQIVDLVWDDNGVSALILQHGSVIILDAKVPARFWIKDGSAPRGKAEAVLKQLPEMEVDPGPMAERIRQDVDAKMGEWVDDQVAKDQAHMAALRAIPDSAFIAATEDELRKRVNAAIGVDPGAPGGDKGVVFTGTMKDGKVMSIDYEGFDAINEAFEQIAARRAQTGFFENPLAPENLIFKCDQCGFEGPPTIKLTAVLCSGCGKVLREEDQPGVLNVKGEKRLVVHDRSGNPGTLDTPRHSDRTCTVCRLPMTVQIWSASDGGHEDEKYSCPNGHTQWVDGIDS